MTKLSIFHDFCALPKYYHGVFFPFHRTNALQISKKLVLSKIPQHRFFKNLELQDVFFLAFNYKSHLHLMTYRPT